MTWARIYLAHSVRAIGSLLKVHPLKLAPSIHGKHTFPCICLVALSTTSPYHSPSTRSEGGGAELGFVLLTVVPP